MTTRIATVVSACFCLLSGTDCMNVNYKKTKEMVLGSLSKEPMTPLAISAKPVEQVSEYKILGVTVNASLKWDSHINAVTSKAAKRLWFLKELKRAGVDKEDLAYFFQAVVRPIIEYACPVGTRASRKNSHKSSKISKAVLSRLLLATSHTKKRVVYLVYSF